MTKGINSDNETDKGMGRRTLVRAGATAAWTVPIVALAAPAGASPVCSGPNTTLTITPVGSPVKTNQGKTLTQTFTVCNTGAGDTCGLSATASFTGQGSFTSFSVGDWPANTTTGQNSLTVIAPSNEQLTTNTCLDYLVTIVLSNNAGRTIDLSFQSSNGGLATTQIAF